MDLFIDKYSIKNLLFTKALPNYVIPVPIDGHKVYACTDCGDKFIFESSLNDHINRNSVKISYMCRYCNQLTHFNNRCNLLHHIRSHVFKTATINVSDLKIEPLPLSNYKIHLTKPPKSKEISSQSTSVKEMPLSVRKLMTSVFCLECKSNLTSTGVAYRDRINHYMQYTNEVYSCPVCLFALPSVCALKTHLRLHLACPPYCCPECGIHLSAKNVDYPYNHDCEGFKMMRATARLNCAASDCRLFHPNDYKDHMKEFHMKPVYKCPYCVVACFNDKTMQKHLLGHNTDDKPLVFFQCELCPGKFVMQSHMETHLKNHPTTLAFPCWPCGAVFKEVSLLLHHVRRKHNKSDVIKEVLTTILSEYEMYSSKPKRIYRVVKRCDQCKRSFTYKCKYEEIHILPNECPYKCVSNFNCNVSPDNARIICHLCKNKMSEDWTEIKKHYAAMHKGHKCLDAKIVLNRIDVKKILSQRKISRSRAGLKTIDKNISRKRNKRHSNKRSTYSIEVDNDGASSSRIEADDDKFMCTMCENHYEDKLSLEKHIVSHRDPCMAYQCLECGQSFVVKPSFLKHLLLKHGISDVEDYITRKPCYNETALMRYQNIIVPTLAKNQCAICLEQFEGPEDLKKHFKVHGMAVWRS